jgi:hypothetical protein
MRREAFGLDEATEKLGDMSQQNVYLTLLHFAKSICSRKAEDPVWARRTMLSFNEMRDGMYGKSNESLNVAELQPAKGQPKGRPRKSQIARQVTAGLSVRRSHCQHLSGLTKVRQQNACSEADNKTRRCRICLGTGHNALTCPHRRQRMAADDQASQKLSALTIFQAGDSGGFLFLQLFHVLHDQRMNQDREAKRVQG